MPVLDDEFLGTLFTQAGAAFDVPASGASDIVRRAGGAGSADSEADPPSPRRLGGVIRAHRLLTVAAGLIVVAVLASLGFSLRPAAPGRPRATGSVPSEAARPAGPAGTRPVEHSNAALAPAPQTFGTQAAGAHERSLSSTGSSTSASPAAAASSEVEQTGSLDLRVHHGGLSPTISALMLLATNSHGFVANSQTKDTAAGGAPRGSITLQVPVSSFPAVLQEAQGLGKVLQLTTKATDVSGHYVDLQSRITALEASRQQYLTIMAKATSISDILAVQAQLDGLQSQIEQLQGEFQVLTDETTYSSLTVAVSEPGPVPAPPPRPPSGIDRAWQDSVHGFIDGVEGVIGIAGPALFTLLCVGLAAVAGRLMWRRWQRHSL
jgi:hypothetical protein